MKRFSRAISAIVAILFLCLGSFLFSPAQRADGSFPIALPDAGIYDQYQLVTLSSDSGATVTYSVYGRAQVPATPYDITLTPKPKILIDDDCVLSVNSEVGGVVKYREFTYTINPKILSTYPANGAANMPLRPTIEVRFSREMDKSWIENISNISNFSVRKAGDLIDLPVSVSYQSNRDAANPYYILRIYLSSNLAAGTVYTVTLKNMRDSNGKLLQGMNSFSFTTAPETGYSTYGSVTTDKTYYDKGQYVYIRGTFVQNGQELNGIIPAIQARVFNPLGVLKSTISINTLNYGKFQDDANYRYQIPYEDTATGTWTVRLYDNSPTPQFLNSCTFTVGGVESPVPDKYGDSKGYRYFEPIAVSLSTGTPGTTIYYTTDDNISVVDDTCALYRGPVSISSTATLRAVAYKGGVKSATFSERYTILSYLGVMEFKPKRDPNSPPDNVSIYIAPEVIFGRPVKAETVINNFNLVECDSNLNEIEGAYVKGTVSYDALTKKAVFKPANPLKPFTYYLVKLQPAITDLNGVPLEIFEVRDWYFKTGAGLDIWVNSGANNAYVQVSNNYISVNKNPVTLKISLPGAVAVTINGGEATGIGNSQFTSVINLKPGNNVITIITTDTGSVKTTNLFTINYLGILQEGASVTTTIPAKGKVELFEKQLTMEFPKGTYLKDASGQSLADQSLVVTVMQIPMPDGFPSVSHTYDIQPKTAGADLNNKGEGTLTLAFDKYVSASSASTLTVLFDMDGDGFWEETLGGKVDIKKRTITVPFGNFGRYVVVNKVWTFADYSTTGWARSYVEYLWSKGVMKPLPSAGTGQFGLIDSQGQEIPITRGEFAVMVGKALGLNKANYSQFGIFADMRLAGISAYARDLDGYWRAISPDDYKYIDMLARNGVLHGSLDSYGSLVFHYHSIITREEVAVILARAMNLAVETDDAKVRTAITKLYTDANTSISAWAQPYVLAASRGYFGGFPDKTFRGQDNFTRPQAARIIYQTMKKGKLM